MRRLLVVALLLGLCATGCDPAPVGPDAGFGSDAAPSDAEPPDVGPDRGDATPSDASFLDGAAPDTGTLEVDAGSDAGARDGGTTYGPPMHVGTLPATGLPETSGIVASRASPGVFWTENDSGNPADIFAIDVSGARLATIHLGGVTNVDMEDISIDRRAGVEELYVADVGDNAARTSDGVTGRASVFLYRLPEPSVAAGDQTITPERFTFTYPARPYDCESVFVDHRTGDVYFVTKEASPAEVFVARAPLDASTTTELTPAGTIDLSIATAADMSTDGTRIVVRGYGLVHVFPIAPTPTSGDVAAAFAGGFLTTMPGAAAEAIAFEDDGYGLYTVPEGDGAFLYYIPSE